MNDLQQVEQEIARYKDQVAVGEQLERLSSNKDFQSLILNGFLRDNAVRLVHLKSHPGQQKPESQAAILREIDGIAALNDHLRMIRQLAGTAKESLANAEETRIHLISELSGAK